MKNKYLLARVLAFIFDYMTVTLLGGIFAAMIFPNNIAEEEFNKILLLLEEATPDTEAMFAHLSVAYISMVSTMLITASVYILYFVIIAKLFNNRTLGCIFTNQFITKTDGTKLTQSDLTAKMLLTNGGLYYLVFSLIFILFENNITVAIILMFIFILTFGIFLISNFIVLLTTNRSLVDRITKTRPILVIKKLD